MLSNDFIEYLLNKIYTSLIHVDSETNNEYPLNIYMTDSAREEERKINKFKENLNKIKSYMSSKKDHKLWFDYKVMSRKIHPKKFNLALQDQTYPFISNIHGDKLEVSSVVYTNVNFKNSSRFSPKFKSIYNKKFFKNGLDINNFEILNVYDRQGNTLKGRDVFDDILKNGRGGIVPLNEKQGFFIPHEYPFKYTYGLEYEIPINPNVANNFRYIGATDENAGHLYASNNRYNYPGDERVSELFYYIYSQYVKKYGFDPFNLLNFTKPNKFYKSASDYGLFTFSENDRETKMRLRKHDGVFYAYYDGSVDRSDDVPSINFEMPTGIMNITNGIVFNHYLMNAFKEFGFERGEEYTSKFTNMNGMHINIGFNNIMKFNDKTNLHKAVVNFLTAIGFFGQRLFKDFNRMNNELLHGSSTVSLSMGEIDRELMSTRFDKKILNNVLEYRHPGMILDSGYIANQLIYSSKIHDDILSLAKYFDENPSSYLYSSGSAVNNQPTKYVFRPGRPNVREQWVRDFFKNYMGFDDFMTDWAFNMHLKCSRVRSDTDEW